MKKYLDDEHQLESRFSHEVTKLEGLRLVDCHAEGIDASFFLPMATIRVLFVSSPKKKLTRRMDRVSPQRTSKRAAGARPR